MLFMPARAFPILGAVVLMAAGCAFTPQNAVIDPRIHVTPANIGQGREVALMVKDERSEALLGRRGTGAMNGAEISTDQDVPALFGTRISEGLVRRGFRVVPTGTPAPRKVTVELRELAYRTSMGFWTGGVHVNGALKIIATHGDQTYERIYRAQEEQRAFFVNFASENEAILNAASTALLQQVADDQQLTRFLAR